MKTGLFRGVLVVAFLFLAACRTAPVHNVESATFGIPNLTAAKAKAAIVRAGASLGWQMRETGPGKMVGTLNVRAHKAVVDIAYNTKNFSINYKDSRNLRYDGTTIHSNYNGWVSNLVNAIQTQVQVQ